MMTDMIRTISRSEYLYSTVHRQLANRVIERSGHHHEDVTFIERVGRTWELTVWVDYDAKTTKVVRVPVIGDE